MTDATSRRLIIVVDESKLSPVLGSKHSLPVEVARFGWESQARYLASLGGRPARIRKRGGRQQVR